MFWCSPCCAVRTTTVCHWQLFGAAAQEARSAIAPRRQVRQAPIMASFSLHTSSDFCRVSFDRASSAVEPAKHQSIACAVYVRMSGRKFRRKLVPSDAAAAPVDDSGEEPGSLAIPPSALAARRPERGLAPRPAAKPLLSFGGDEDNSAAPARRRTAARGLEPDGRLRGVARAAALAVTEVRVGASTQVSGAGAAPAKPRRCWPAEPLSTPVLHSATGRLTSL